MELSELTPLQITDVIINQWKVNFPEEKFVSAEKPIGHNNECPICKFQGNFKDIAFYYHEPISLVLISADPNKYQKLNAKSGTEYTWALDRGQQNISDIFGVEIVAIANGLRQYIQLEPVGAPKWKVTPDFAIHIRPLGVPGHIIKAVYYAQELLLLSKKLTDYKELDQALKKLVNYQLGLDMNLTSKAWGNIVKQPINAVSLLDGKYYSASCESVKNISQLINLCNAIILNKREFFPILSVVDEAQQYKKEIEAVFLDENKNNDGTN